MAGMFSLPSPWSSPVQEDGLAVTFSRLFAAKSLITKEPTSLLFPLTGAYFPLLRAVV